MQNSGGKQADPVWQDGDELEGGSRPSGCNRFSCSSSPEQPSVTKVDKPFATAGSIEMQVGGGDDIIRAGPDEHIRVSFAGNIGNASADLGTSGTHANLTIRDTPHSNFRATVEVPAADLTVCLTGGNLDIAAITGNKGVLSAGGRSTVSASDPQRKRVR